jgi:Arc/MetJ-type ribon-helix-helix transcriptional regulator
MNNDRQVAFRLPSALVEKIDAQVEDWSATRPGVRVTRADVVRALLVQGLTENDDHLSVSKAVEEPPRRSKKAQAVTPKPPKKSNPLKVEGSTGLTLVSNSWD